VADAVARHLGVFGEVIASDATQNLTRRIKAAVLEARFGRGGFCYVGSSSVDVPTWRTAGEVMVAGGGRSLDRHLRSEGIAVHRRFNPDGTAFAALIRALRPHQWSKNLLCFLPVLAGHAWMLDSLLRGAGAAASLCCAASGAYLFNDFLDLDHDRDHPKKQARPFAGGTLSPLVALVLSPVLFFAGITFLGGFAPRAVPWLLLYVAVALAYALDLKRRLMVDVVALAILYTLRVSVGGAATGIKPSPWLLAFSITCFASLAMSKRVSELLSLRSAGGVEEARGRGYSVADTPSMQALGIGCSVAAVLVLALYLTSPQSVPLYRHPDRLWFACLALFYWFGRLWLIAGRGRLDEDPILFAVRDPISYATGLIVALAIVLAL
jgi:4-hydroxybenzoate polyprenyltransferase